jgi:hypothetical protein
VEPTELLAVHHQQLEELEELDQRAHYSLQGAMVAAHFNRRLVLVLVVWEEVLF